MKTATTAALVSIALLSNAPPSAAQHCGGPCEVPRPAAPPLSPNPRFTLVPGAEKINWRYLHNFIWTEDGEQKHRLEETLSSPQMVAFGYRRIFVSPAGNGFLVTGNAYSEGHPYFRLDGSVNPSIGPPLFVFCSPEGTPLVEVPLKQGLSSEEWKHGPCPYDCGCEDILYVFEKDPSLSANECFVELIAAGTGRALHFFLPLGAPVEDRAAFEDRLVELEWARIPPELQLKKRAEIKTLVTALEAGDLAAHADAEATLLEIGFLALPALRAARTGSADLEVRARRVEERLRPWAAAGYEAMSIDLDLLEGLLDYPEEAVVEAVRARLAQILPESAATDWGGWIRQNHDRLQWNTELRRYTKK